MTLSQINALKNLFSAFESDYQLSEQLYQRSVEIDETIKARDVSAVFMRVADQLGISRTISTAAADDPEFEEIISSLNRQIAGVIAKWDLAYSIIAARDAA